MSSRQAAVAGTFYPDNPQILAQMIQGYLEKIEAPDEQATLKALVSPHAGYVYSGIVAASCYKRIQQLSQDINWTIFLLGPTHRVPVRGISVGVYDAYETPLGSVKVSAITQKIAQQYGFVPQTHMYEHCLEVQLPFLQLTLQNFEIVPILVCNMHPQQLKQILEPYLNENTLVIASSDLSHYHPYETARELDHICNEAIPNLDIARMTERGDACGKLPILTVMELAKEHQWKGRFLDYKNSGDTSGDKSRVVGYGAYSFVEQKH